MQHNPEAPIISQEQHNPRQPINEQNLDLKDKNNIISTYMKKSKHILLKMQIDVTTNYGIAYIRILYYKHRIRDTKFISHALLTIPPFQVKTLYEFHVQSTT